MTDRGDQHLPDILDRIAQAAGEEAALLVARELGGRPFFLPLVENLTAEHRLVEVVGLKRAKAICETLGYGEITFPRGPYSSIGERARHVAELIAQRKSHAAIALATNLHIRTVERIAARLRQPDDDGNQGVLL